MVFLKQKSLNQNYIQNLYETSLKILFTIHGQTLKEIIANLVNYGVLT